jgi:hypothetical protein
LGNEVCRKIDSAVRENGDLRYEILMWGVKKTKRGRRVSWSVRAAPPVEDSETFGAALEMPRDAGERQKYAPRAIGEL